MLQTRNNTVLTSPYIHKFHVTHMARMAVSLWTARALHRGPVAYLENHTAKMYQILYVCCR